MPNYAIKEIFFTLQGEGLNAGRPAIFCRFTGCNLWSGKEKDRSKAVCQFCDTDFVGMNGTDGGRYDDAKGLATKIESFWPDGDNKGRFVVLTGGEPLLQVDRQLIEALHERSFEIAVETNGTKDVPQGLDWVCVSPKAGAPLQVKHGNELKLVYPQNGAEPELFSDLAFDHFLLQPMDNEFRGQNTKDAIEYCLRNPKWRLSIQTHKDIGIR